MEQNLTTQLEALAAKRLEEQPRDFKEARALWAPLVAPFEVTMEDITALCKEKDALERLIPRDGVIALYFEDLLEAYAKKVGLAEDWWDVDYMEGAAMLDLFMQKNKCSYYSEEKHNFFVFRAIEKAKKEGNNIVICENLS